MQRPARALRPGRARAAGRQADDEFPLRLTTGRRLDEYNTGVQTGGLRLAACAAAKPSTSRRRTPSGTACARARSSASARGAALEVPVRIDDGLRPGLTFMTFHFPDEVATNLLTIDATDPKSGTAEFKATAIRIEPVELRWTSTPSRRPSDAVDRASDRRARLGGGAAIDADGRRRSAAAARRCDLLLPALHAVQDRIGWISRGALNYICRRLAVPPAEAVGRRHLLPSARHAAAPARRRARLRRHRLPHPRRRGAVRSAGARAGPGRRRPRRQQRELDAQSLPGPVRAGAGRARHRRRRGAANHHARARRGRRRGDCRAAGRSAGDGRHAGGRRDAGAALGAPGRSARPAPAGPHRPGRSHEPRRLPRQRRLPRAGARHRRWDRPASSPR